MHWSASSASLLRFSDVEPPVGLPHTFDFFFRMPRTKGMEVLREGPWRKLEAVAVAERGTRGVMVLPLLAREGAI